MAQGADQATVSRAIHSVAATTAEFMAPNIPHGDRRCGHFEGRYKAIVRDRDSYLLELVRYIHLNAVRAAMVKRPGEWRWSGHKKYLGKEKSGLIDCAVMGELRTAARYEAFIREGAKVNYRAEWHPGEGAPFLGLERFVKKIVKETIPPPVSRRSSYSRVWQPMRDFPPRHCYGKGWLATS